MFIQTEATPNPATLKFIPGRLVLDGGTLEFATRESAARSPLAEKLFGVPGVIVAVPVYSAVQLILREVVKPRQDER